MSLITKDEIDQILNIRILRLASKLSLIFQRESLRPAGVSVQQWRVLVSLAQYGELHLRLLARHSAQDPAHTSRVVKTMISKGWVESRDDMQDKRRIQYDLTRDGIKIVEKIWPDAKLLAADISNIFSDTEFVQLKNLLDRANASCEARLKDDADT